MSDSLAADGPAPGNRGRPAVEAANITKRYGSTLALDNVGITVVDGETHALVGRNGAGKSTLVAVLTGLQVPDAGTVRFNGEPAPSTSDRDGWRRVVACVFQKSTIIPSLSIAENLFLNRQQSSSAGLIGWRSLRSRAQAMLDEWGIGVDVRDLAGILTVEQRQMVEIARALSFGARFIILDEPTAQLDPPGIERLFNRLRALQEQGVTFLFISHHLEEIFQVCQTVTVFRDARHILTAPVADMTQAQLVDAMTGDATTLTADQGLSAVPHGEPVLKVRDLTVDGQYHAVSFDVRAGEVVGITGSGGSGRIAVAETIVGLRSADSGTVDVGGVVPKPGSVPAALGAGIGFVPRDRHAQGYVPALGVAENVTMTMGPRIGKGGFINLRRRDEFARGLMRELSIVASGPEQQVQSLSGGNQQKVVMARALATNPKVLVLMHPTAGVDVRSKETLLQAADRLRAQGAGVLIVSDELEDLRPCDRVLVMLHGRVFKELPRGWSDVDVVAATEGIGSDNE